MTANPLVLGVDGGGTKTLAWLATARSGCDETIIGRGQAGPSNPRAVGFDRALEELETAIARAFDEAARPREQVAAACFALAGTDRPDDRAIISRWAQESHIARQVDLVHDGEPILACGTQHGWGIALISGTGSLAFGRNAQGDAARVGGWGYLFGDEGSGYALAIAGLRAAAWNADGRGPDTSLVARLQQRLKIDKPMDLIEAVYHRDVDRRAIADLAKLVLEAAAAGDSVASRIVDGAASDLAEMVLTLKRRLQLDQPNLPLALAGSLLLRGEPLKQRFVRRLEDAVGDPPTITLVAQPVQGAVALAAQTLKTES